jgi:hypothetical protein
MKEVVWQWKIPAKQKGNREKEKTVLSSISIWGGKEKLKTQPQGKPDGPDERHDSGCRISPHFT